MQPLLRYENALVVVVWWGVGGLGGRNLGFLIMVGFDFGLTFEIKIEHIYQDQDQSFS